MKQMRNILSHISIVAVASGLALSASAADMTPGSNPSPSEKVKKKTKKKSKESKNTAQAQPAAQAEVLSNSTGTPDKITTTAAAPSSSVSTNVGQSTTNLNASGSKSILNNFGFRYDSAFYGPSTYGLSMYQPSMWSQTSSIPIFLRNALSALYTIPNTNNVMVGATLRADVFPTGYASTPGNSNYNIDDSYIHITAPKLIDKGNFTMLGALRVYFPSSQYSRSVGQSVSFTTRIVPNYNVPNSRFSVGIIAWNQYYTNQAWGANNNAAIEDDAYVGPNINYQLFPTISVGVLAEFEAERYRGTPTAYSTGFTGFTPDNPVNPTPFDIEPNVSWDITPTINFNPFLNMYPGANFGFATASVGFYFGAKLL